MPLENRVTPFGDIVAVAERGLLMGNRGGRLHDLATRTLGRRRWISKQWISCQLEFGGRHRQVMGHGYTELFFLDEVTALAAGHRPCHLCRRAEALAFAAAWQAARRLEHRPRAAGIDRVLHPARTPTGRRAPRLLPFADLPDGTMIAFSANDAASHGDRHVWAIRGDWLHRWDHAGYRERRARPRDGMAPTLTPPSVVETLRSGYRPVWHPSIDERD